MLLLFTSVLSPWTVYDQAIISKLMACHKRDTTCVTQWRIGVYNAYILCGSVEFAQVAPLIL